MKLWLFAAIAFAAVESLAGGSNGSVTPGAKTVSGKISEWPVPTPKYARDPAIGPDGNIYFSVWAGDKIARFDPKSNRFQEWDTPVGMHPRGILVAPDGKVLFGGAGNGAIGELDPATGKIKLYKLRFNDSDPYTLIFDAQGAVWFVQRRTGLLAKLDRTNGRIVEYPIGDQPYALSIDKSGAIWVTRRSADRMVRFDPKTGEVTELSFVKGSQPRRTVVAPDGMLWVTLFGNGRLAKIDPVTRRLVAEYGLPGGPNSGPYAVNADAAGRIWVSETQTDKVVVFDPRSDETRVFKLPSRDSGVRKAAIDTEGRYWYVGSDSGKLGVIE